MKMLQQIQLVSIFIHVFGTLGVIVARGMELVPQQAVLWTVIISTIWTLGISVIVLESQIRKPIRDEFIEQAVKDSQPVNHHDDDPKHFSHGL